MYKICESGSVAGLAEQVNMYCMVGCKPIGGIATANGYFYQAVEQIEIVKPMEPVRVEPVQPVHKPAPVMESKINRRR